MECLVICNMMNIRRIQEWLEEEQLWDQIAVFDYPRDWPVQKRVCQFLVDQKDRNKTLVKEDSRFQFKSTNYFLIWLNKISIGIDWFHEAKAKFCGKYQKSRRLACQSEGLNEMNFALLPIPKILVF